MSQIKQELDYLRSQGLVLPRHPAAAMKQAQAIGTVNKRMMADIGQQSVMPSPMRRHASSDIAMAIPRFYDPLEFWDLSGLPWNMQDEGHRHKIHQWMRLYYSTHPLVPILIDIFTRFPLVGMEVYHPDDHIQQFYEEVFLSELKYEEFFVDFGRELFLIGEVFPLGHFNEALGVWDREEILNPEDMVIENFSILGQQQLKITPPEHLRRIVQTKQPSKEYKMLLDHYPDLIPYLVRGEPFPISDVLLKHVALKDKPWDDHGTPHMLRGLRTLIHEEKLLASQDAIAERMYSPLILAKLGYPPAQQQQGWLPGPDQLQSFRDDMDNALSSDFRLLVHHFAVEMQSVFGREQVPDLGGDFDRIDRRLMQLFGLNPNILAGGGADAPYASSALHAEFLNQKLRTYQYTLKQHFRDRALIVAEANQHYAYEKRGSTRVPIMERVLEEDDEGNTRVVERPKLLEPELMFGALDLRDEATERQYLQSLRQMGAPISDERMMVGVSFEYKDSLDEMSEEQIQKTVAQQMAKVQAYKILKQQGLPIPPALQQEVEGQPQTTPPGGPMGAPPMGGDMPPPMGGGMGGPPPDLGPGGMGLTEGPPQAQPFTPGPEGAAPDISHERKPGMPTMSSKMASEEAQKAFDEQLETSLANGRYYLETLEAQKRQRRAKSAARAFKREENESTIILDRVPPAYYEQQDRLAVIEGMDDDIEP